MDAITTTSMAAGTATDMRAIFALIALVIAAPAIAKGGHGSSHSGKAATGTGSNPSSHSVHGYVTKRGTYVAPHRQSNSDSTKTNNWSTKGNTNPYTGKPGSR